MTDTALHHSIENAYASIGANDHINLASYWNVRKLGLLLKPVSIKNCPGLQLLSITREKGVIVRDTDNQDSNHNFIPDDLSGYKVLLEGQFGMNKMKAWQGSYGISKHTGIVSPAYYVFDFLDDINPTFFNWAIRSKLYISFFGQASDGVRIGQWDLSKPRMKVIPFLYPSISEQTAIADFLDDKTTKIDRAIAVKEKQIELLKERKQILIQNAVTRGLNPDAPMKDSGVDWIGEIPAHWEVMPLKFFARLKSGDTISSESFTPKGFPVFGGNGFRGFTDRYTNEGNFVLVGRQGALCGNVNYAHGQFFASEHAIVIYPLKPATLKWIGCIIEKANFNRLSQSAAQPGISVETVKNVMFPFAPFDEQKKIHDFIVKIEKGFEFIEKCQSTQIKNLKEYKTSLINSAVTGKIKVTA